MLPIGASLALVGVAVLVATLHLVMARWRDLGPLTVGLCGVGLGLALPAPTDPVLAGVVLAMLISSMAWARGGARGVGRPALTGLVVAAAIAGPALVRWLEGRVDVPSDRLQWASASAVGLLALVTTGLALLRARPGLPPPRWFGEIPVQGPAAAEDQSQSQ